eukprot:s8714_g1.t1
MYLTLRGGETWLPFNTLSPFVTFAPSLIYPDLTTMRRRSSGDWMSTPDDHMGHRGTSLAPGLEMMVSLWSLPAASRPLSIPLLVARHVENHGGCSADMLATLLAVGQSWEVHGYMTFVQEWVDRLAQLLGSTLVDAASRDLGDAGRNWVVYVERSLRKEFLEMVVPDESMEHAVRVSQGEGNTHLLPPVEGATVAAQERRALFNDLQRLTPLLRRLMGEDEPVNPSADHEPVNPSADRALHRSEWVGTGVQYFYDCHLTGFFTGELLPLLWDAILARGDHDFALAARGYLREVENQVGTFLGQDQAVRPPSSLEWAQGMAEALHLLHHHEGLNVTDRVGRQAVDCSEQRDGTEGGGDETSMVQRDQPKRKWLAPPSRRRRQGPSSRGPNRERDAERSGPERSRGADSQSARCSNERVDLGAMARARAARDRAEPRREVSKPKPKTKSRPKQAIRDAPARSEEARPSERDPPPPLTLEEAVDTWLLVLGIRGIDEGMQDFLPERVVGAIQETFMGFEGVDRLTMALAFTRVVQNLLSSVGRLLEQAVTLPVPSARDPNAAEEVEVEVDEEDDDSSLYMQLGMREPWTQASQQEEADKNLVERRVGTSEARKRKVAVVELSSGSADAPRVSRMLRVPTDDAGVAQLSLRLWVEDGVDSEDMTTEPAGCMSPVTAPDGTESGLPCATLEQMVENDTQGLEALSELTFAEVQEVFTQWMSGALSSAEVTRRHGRATLHFLESQWAVTRRHGRATLHFLESQWAVQGGTQEESARVRLLADAPAGELRTGPTRVYADFQDLFVVWKSGGISSADVVAAYGPAVLERLRRAWCEYMSGAHAAVAVARDAGSGSEQEE